MLLVLGAAPDVWAGAWTLPKNRWYAEYYYRVFQSKKQFDQDGNTSRRPKVGMFRDIRNEWKLEYGVTDWLNLLASAPYQSAHYREDGPDLLNSGVGDIYVRTKLRLLNTPLLQDKDPLVGSVQFSWKIPGAYDPHLSPGLGDGQFDFESRLQLSQSWVFSPYEVRTPRKPSPRSQTRHDSPSLRRAAEAREAAIREAIHLAGASREAAMQDAVQLAAYFQEGLRFAEQGRHQEAAECFKAVADHDPTHDDASWRMFNEALAAAKELEEAYYGFRPASQEVVAFEPVPVSDAAPRPSTEMEIRYARVAFVNLEGAFTARNEDPANEFPLLFEAGFTPFKRLMLVGSLESTISVNSTHEQIENFAKWGVRAIFNLWGDGFASVFREGEQTVNVEVGYNDVFAGRNTADAFEIFGKLSFFF